MEVEGKVIVLSREQEHRDAPAPADAQAIADHVHCNVCASCLHQTTL
jgi:predicted HNH restriction endonuclease